jgi:hypothetical protein
LVESRRELTNNGKGRAHHRLLNISSEDYGRAMQELGADLSRGEEKPSGFDWSTITRTIIDRYADRLRALQLALNPIEASDPSKRLPQNSTAIALAVRKHLMIMLMPYLLYGAVPSVPSSTLSSNIQNTRNTSWVEPIRHYCATTLTSYISFESLTRSERMIKVATDGVLNRICSTITDMWVDAFPVTSEAISPLRALELSELVKGWRDQLDGLMKWLDWPMWDICRPACPEQVRILYSILSLGLADTFSSFIFASRCFVIFLRGRGQLRGGRFQTQMLST